MGHGMPTVTQTERKLVIRMKKQTRNIDTSMMLNPLSKCLTKAEKMRITCGWLEMFVIIRFAYQSLTKLEELKKTMTLTEIPFSSEKSRLRYDTKLVKVPKLHQLQACELWTECNLLHDVLLLLSLKRIHVAFACHLLSCLVILFFWLPHKKIQF